MLSPSEETIDLLPTLKGLTNEGRRYFAGSVDAGPAASELDLTRDTQDGSIAISEMSPSVSYTRGAAPNPEAEAAVCYGVSISTNTYQALRAASLRDNRELDNELGEAVAKQITDAIGILSGSKGVREPSAFCVPKGH